MPLRIAVADDEPDMREYFERILPRLGHEVVAVAATGTELVEQCRRERPDLVITDIKMPDMDGRDLFAELQKNKPALAERTVFITGDTVSPDTRSFLNDVKNPVLAKPFRIREVRETISAILDET